MAIRTIFTMAEDCARDEVQGWLEFVRGYAPIARNLLQHYSPALEPELDLHITRVFQRARDNGNAWFAGLHFANEREFLMAFRELVFAYVRAAGRETVPQVSLDQAREALRDLTVVQRELLWMFVKRYDAPQAAAILMNAESTARELQESIQARLTLLMAGGESAEVVRALLEHTEETRTPDCLPLKTFNNLINGQISWQERDRAERHISGCMHCLDRFTSFQEMIWHARQATPLSESESEQLLRSLGVSPKFKGLMARLLRKTA